MLYMRGVTVLILMFMWLLAMKYSEISGFKSSMQFLVYSPCYAFIIFYLVKKCVCIYRNTDSLLKRLTYSPSAVEIITGKWGK